jgi:hypothetical protein
MKKRKYYLAGSLIIVLAALSVTASFAAVQKNPVRARAQFRLAQRIGIRGFVKKLNLTPDQKTQIKTVLQNNKTQIQQAARNTVKARLDLAKGYEGAAGELAAAQSQAAGLRKQIFDSVRPILTQDQLSKMQQLQQLREQRLQRKLDRLNSRIGG